MEGNVHESHRERVREKFKSGGFEGWCDQEILELLLFYAIPRADTNPIAHRLIDRFGTLSGVLDADITALLEVDGIGMSTACYISALGRLPAEYLRSKWSGEKISLSNSTAAGRYCTDYIGSESEEVLAVICLDAKNQVKSKRIISRGMSDRVDVSIRKIVQAAFDAKVNYVVLCHNHPSGSAHPSQQDIDMTNAVAAALRPLDIELCDHIVVGGDTFTSMADRGFIKN